MPETSRKNYKKEQDKGHHNREDKRNMARKRDAWSIPL
jgi:hypothetical protein